MTISPATVALPLAQKTCEFIELEAVGGKSTDIDQRCPRQGYTELSAMGSDWEYLGSQIF